jgi:hypothetical protein
LDDATSEPNSKHDAYLDGATGLVANVCEALSISSDEASRIRVALLHEPALNARAVRSSEGGYLIEVNLGATFLAEDTFFRLLSNRRVWPDVGEFSLEGEEPTLTDYCANAQDLFSFGTVGDAYSRPAPRCEIRCTYAAWLNALCWDYLVLHELGHVLHGHFSYMVKGAAAFTFEEPSVQERPLSQRPDLTRQALELDADTFALEWVLNTRIRGAPNERLGRPPDAPRAFVALDVVRAIYTMQALFCGSQDEQNHRIGGTHPPPRVRQSLLLSAIINWIPIDNNQLAVTALMHEVAAMEAHYGILTGRARATDSMQRLRDRHALDVMARWRDVFGELKEFAFYGLPNLPVWDDVHD